MEGWTTESVLKKHNLWRELAGPAAGPTAITLQWQDMRISNLERALRTIRDKALRCANTENAEYKAAIRALFDTVLGEEIFWLLSTRPNTEKGEADPAKEGGAASALAPSGVTDKTDTSSGGE